MDSTLFSDIQKTLKHKYGRFFYKTKLGKSPKPDDLMIKYKAGQKGEVEIEGPSPEFGGIFAFIDWFENEHGKDADFRWNKLIKRIENLTDSKEGRVFIMQRLSNLRGFVESEEHRKDYYKKLYKAETQRQKRKQKKEIEKYKEAIETIRDLDPNFDKDHKYLNLAKERSENIKPSETLLTLKYFQDYGLMWSTEQKQKSTKGLQTIRNFFCEVYRVAEEHSSLKPNAIYIEIENLLDLLKIKNKEGNDYTRENIKGIIKRNYRKVNPSKDIRTMIQNLQLKKSSDTSS